MTITVVPEVSEETQKSTGTSLQDGTSENCLTGASPLAGKTLSQIRIMAQGALLGLAPHNIRFNELVKENINPDILRQLYRLIRPRMIEIILRKFNALLLAPFPQSHQSRLVKNLTFSLQVLRKPFFPGTRMR